MDNKYAFSLHSALVKTNLEHWSTVSNSGLPSAKKIMELLEQVQQRDHEDD